MVIKSLLNQSVARGRFPALACSPGCALIHCFFVQARSLSSTSLLAPQVLCVAGPNRNRPICAPWLAIALNSVSKSNPSL